MLILGIETSCDETAVSIIKGQGKKIEVIANVVSSQIKIHQQYGGVVPEVAARQHIINILPVLDQSLQQAKIKKNEARKKISAIAVTTGPGLITSLLIGVETAKNLAYVWNLPLISVNHIAGHIYANFINNTKIQFPSITLTVSGGHTMLVLMKNHLQYKIIGETRDDAAGEAFDKGAKLLGLGYPGGPIISQYAQRYSETKEREGNNQTKQVIFPRPMIHKDNFDFSFSGLKTALLYQLKKDKNWQKKIPEYCWQYQEAIIDSLIFKTIKAGKKYKVKSILLAGGVSANQRLRQQFLKQVSAQLPTVKLFIPDLKYTTDNATMIATLGYFKYQKQQTTPWQKIIANPNLKL